jgi:hypothetical protein
MISKLLNSLKKEIIIQIIGYLYFLVFIYAAVSKILDFENFQVQLGQSPIVNIYSGWLPYIVIGIEITTSILLSSTKTRLLGLYISLALMSCFTTYIYIILNYSSFIPCSCGGLIDKMSWQTHFIFNLIFIILSILAIFFTKRQSYGQTLFKCFMIISFSIILVTIMFLISENATQYKNPFIRRFYQSSVIKTKEIILNNHTQYFIGSDQNNIYIGDYLAPLYITSFNKNLKTRTNYKIQLEIDSLPFRSVQVKISEPYFYLIDGTIPVIYRGLISDWKADILMINKNCNFSRAEITSSNTIAFRGIDDITSNNIIGQISYKDSLTINYFPKILQKQIDGTFDTDGMLVFDKFTKKLLYIYYYRNQFIVTDNQMNLLFRGNTIDTISQAKIKVKYFKETGIKKLASPPLIVNKLSAASNNLLFNNSAIMGLYEPKEMWKEASVIDVYDINNKSYILSFYIHNINQKKVNAIYADDKSLYAIIGNTLVKYDLNEQLLKKQNK